MTDETNPSHDELVALLAEWEEYPSSPEGRCAIQLRAALGWNS